MKKLIITVDTEGDNLWNWHQGEEIQTENVRFIPQFQDLCEKYGFIPTYLTNYEMALDKRWVNYGKRKVQEGKCEIGMHIHAWNSPPYFALTNNYGGNPYITEYPEESVRNKVHFLKRMLEERFECDIKSNRSGRWATNAFYFSVLKEEGIIVDCSVTPHLDLSNITGCMYNYGNDYRNYPTAPYYITDGLLEVPMITRRIHRFGQGTWKHKVKNALLGEEMWLRPHTKSLDDLIQLTKAVEKENIDYLEFMIHSSELMPGGSPYFKNEEEIKSLYSILERYFEKVASSGYRGSGLAEYAEAFNQD